MERLTGLLGVGVMIGLVWVLSNHRRRFPTRVVVGGLILQFVFARLVRKTGPGQATILTRTMTAMGCLMLLK